MNSNENESPYGELVVRPDGKLFSGWIVNSGGQVVWQTKTSKSKNEIVEELLSLGWDIRDVLNPFFWYDPNTRDEIVGTEFEYLLERIPMSDPTKRLEELIGHSL